MTAKGTVFHRYTKTKRTYLVQVRITEEQGAQLEQRAKEIGKTPSALACEILEGWLFAGIIEPRGKKPA